MALSVWASATILSSGYLNLFYHMVLTVGASTVKVENRATGTIVLILGLTKWPTANLLYCDGKIQQTASAVQVREHGGQIVARSILAN
jgi:hypothetical protein